MEGMGWDGMEEAKENRRVAAVLLAEGPDERSGATRESPAAKRHNPASLGED